MADHNSFANLIWQIADLLRGPYEPGPRPAPTYIDALVRLLDVGAAA